MNEIKHSKWTERREIKMKAALLIAILIVIAVSKEIQSFFFDHLFGEVNLFIASFAVLLLVAGIGLVKK